MTFKRLFLPLAGLLIALSLTLSSCNKDSSDTPFYVEPSSVAVNGFSLKANTKVLSGLDSVFFSIDLERGLIFNADSLPKGTKVDALIPIIALPSSVTKANIIMEGGSKRTGEVDYLKNSDDSIDFTGRVVLELMSAEGNSRAYEVKVNVHTMEPDSLWWGNTAIAKLPSRLEAPVEQRTVQTGDGSVAAVIAEADGSYTFSSSADAFSGVWTKNRIELPFVPKVRSLAFCDSRYYMLAADGSLYSSPDGVGGWGATGEKWSCILGAYGNALTGISLPAQGDALEFTSFPAGVMGGSVPDGFPVSGYTDMLLLNSKWWDNPYAVIYGGTDRAGKLSGAVWAFDGSHWAQISNGGVPALDGAAMIPYFAYRRTDKSWIFNEYSVLMVMGGRDADGNLNRDMYVSYDNGVFWSKASELMQMPEYIPGMYDLDAVAATTEMSGNFEPRGWNSATTPDLPSWFRVDYATDGYDVKWECPYIYLYGGRDSSGKLYNTVWRGVIRRLTFLPLL